MGHYLSREPIFQTTDFIGRAADLAWVVSMLARPWPQNSSLTGEPRIGKTSFLYQIVSQKLGLLPGQKGLHLWVRLAEMPDHRSSTFWQQLLARLYQAQQEAGFGLPIDEELFGDERDLFDAFDELVEQLAEAGCERLFILIDDFDLLEPTFGSRDLDWLRSLSTRHGRWLAFVLSSSEKLVALEDKIRQRQARGPQLSLFANTFQNRPLTLLSEEETVQLCQHTAVAENVPPLSTADIQFLRQEVGRHPALLKIGCSYLFEARTYSPNSPSLHQDVSGDIRLDEQVGWLCRQLWLRRNEEEQAALAQLAQGQTSLADRILQRGLEKHVGLIESRAGKLSLFADLFAYWIQRQTQQPEAKPAKTAVANEEFTFLPDKRLVYIDDRQITLTALESRLLHYLVQHKNEVCTVEALQTHVWGSGKTRSVVEKAINRLRQKIEHDPKRPRFILSARGEGYLLHQE